MAENVTFVISKPIWIPFREVEFIITPKGGILLLTRHFLGLNYYAYQKPYLESPTPIGLELGSSFPARRPIPH